MERWLQLLPRDVRGLLVAKLRRGQRYALRGLDEFRDLVPAISADSGVVRSEKMEALICAAIDGQLELVQHIIQVCEASARRHRFLAA